MTLMPMLSDSDPAESAEGSIDPLGIYPIADTLASRMVPGVRERQRHPTLCRCRRRLVHGDDSYRVDVLVGSNE